MCCLPVSYVLQVCVETALMALVHDFQLTVAPSLLALVEKVQTMDANTDSKSLRIKEAGICHCVCLLRT